METLIAWLNTPIQRELALLLGLAPVVLMAIAYLVHLIRAGRSASKKTDDQSDDPDNNHG
mgnify:CR=1 FL=1